MSSITESNMLRHRSLRAGILLAGILLPQAILFGPSLVGSKVLLPLDLLALEGVYLPRTAEYASVEPHNPMLLDQVAYYELARRFAAAEVRAGRLPLWNPRSYAGVPFVRYGKYSPFSLISYAFPSPRSLVWIHLLKSALAAVGAYLFFRRVLDVSFWPAAIGAWCYPLTGFFVLWLGYPVTLVTAWLPWMLLLTDATVRRPLGFAAPGLAVVTALVLLAGHIDVAGQVILAAGFYAMWCLVDEYWPRTAEHRPSKRRKRAATADWRGAARRAAGAAAATGGAVALGVLLAAPYVLPLVEYARTGSRILERASGDEDRPPVGIAALPQIVLPGMYGSDQADSLRLFDSPRLESSAATYTGLVATLLLAPLAWCSRRHRALNVCWLLLALLGASWVLNLPGIVALLRVPPLNMMSHNRFVFVSSFAILAMAVTGMEVIWQGQADRRAWFLLPMGLLAVLGGWCLYRAFDLPEPLATWLQHDLEAGRPHSNASDLAAIHRVQQSFVQTYITSALLCAAALVAWVALWFRVKTPSWTIFVIGLVLLGDLVWFAYGTNPQCEPGLDYPPIPVLAQLAELPEGRCVAVGCLDANLHETHGLHDVRGYDGIDPKRIVDLLGIARDPNTQGLPYAQVQHYVPRLGRSAQNTMEFPPVLSMLNVRYFIFRGPRPQELVPRLQDANYWVVENPQALPRAYIPRRVRTVADETAMLARLGADNYSPRQVAYVEGRTELPNDCRGTAKIVHEVPTEVTVEADMQTPGLLVLSDSWDPGWQAYRDGHPAPILRTNYAVRGVELPQGKSAVVFRYQPASFAWGLRLTLVATLGLIAWTIVIARRRRGYEPPR